MGRTKQTSRKNTDPPATDLPTKGDPPLNLEAAAEAGEQREAWEQKSGELEQEDKGNRCPVLSYILLHHTNTHVTGNASGCLCLAYVTISRGTSIKVLSAFLFQEQWERVNLKCIGNHPLIH